MRTPEQIKAILRDHGGRFMEEGGDGCSGYVDRGDVRLTFIASWGGHWDHVSVRALVIDGQFKDKLRVPSWREMCYLKGLFFNDNETVMQLHPPEAEYVNTHEHVLHLWKHQSKAIPRPPKTFV